VIGRTKTEVREKLKKLQAEADAGLKTSASYTLVRAVDDWAAEALDGQAALFVFTPGEHDSSPTAAEPSAYVTATAQFAFYPSSRSVQERPCEVGEC
jgi:hypothetical protein